MAKFSRTRNRNGEVTSPIQAVINSKQVTLTPLKGKDGLGVLSYRDKGAVTPYGQWFACEWPDNAGVLRQAEVVCRFAETAPKQTQFSNGKTQKVCFSALMLKPEGGAFELRLEANKDEQTVGFKNKDGGNQYEDDKGFKFATVSEALEFWAEHDANAAKHAAEVAARDPVKWREEYNATNQDILKSNAETQRLIAAQMASKGSGKGASP